MDAPLPLRAARFAALGEPARLTIVEALSLTDLTPTELARITSLPSNLLAHHLGALEEAGLVVRSTSEGDGRRRYVSLVTEHLPEVDRPEPPGGTVGFVCTHNSARSPYAAVRYRQLTGHVASSAGTHPASRVHPLATQVASRFGVDLSGETPGDYSTLPVLDLVVSVCDRALEEGLPPHRRHLHWSVPDPTSEGGTSSFAAAFAEIERRLRRLVGPTHPEGGTR